MVGGQGQLNRLTFTVVCLAGVACALPYLGGGPVWDDHALIIEHLARLGVWDVLSLWGNPVGGGEVGTGYFRPMSMTFLSENQIPSRPRPRPGRDSVLGR